MHIEIDESTGEIVVGKWREERYRVYRSSGVTPPWKVWVQSVAAANGVHLPYQKKEFNKAAAEMFKRSPTAMYKHFKALAYKQFVVPYRDILTKVAFKRGSIDALALRDIRKNFEVAKETYEDGLHNILPLVIKTGKRPAELKKEYGPKWKIMANNSLNKNKALMKKVKPEMYGNFCDKPTSLLQVADRFTNWNGYESVEGFLTYAEIHLRGSWGDKRKLEDAYTIFRDTKRMSKQLEMKFDPKWTPRRMKEEHDNMSAEVNARKYPKTPCEAVKDIPVKELVVGDYTAVLLQSGYEIAEEGTHMGHCVGGYASMVGDGDYLVYSVRKNGERASTVGLYIEEKTAGPYGAPVKTKVVKYNQHYARFNQRVTCEVEASIPNKILELLNKKEQE